MLFKRFNKIICALFWLSTVSFAAVEYFPQTVLDQERLLRREAEERIQKDILDRVLGKDKASVLVTIDLFMETKRGEKSFQEGKIDDKKALGETDYILPWVPAPKSVNQPPATPKDAKLEFEKRVGQREEVITNVSLFDVLIIHDENILQVKLDFVEDAIGELYKPYKQAGVLGVRFKPIPTSLNIPSNAYERIQDVKEKAWRFLEPKNFIMLLLIILIGLPIVLFILFALWPFLKNLLRTMSERAGPDVNVDSKFESPEDEEEKDLKEGKGGGGGGGAGKLEEEERAKTRPFQYIDAENLKRLTYLIQKEPPEIIALVISYLTNSEFVKEIITSLPPELQAKVAVNMATIRQMTQEQVMFIDKRIKEKIEFLVGGLDKLLKVLDEVDSFTRDNILEYLKNEKPTLYEKIRASILTFEDIANLPDPAMQLILRELKTESLSRALHSAAPEIMSKIFSNMSQGAAALLKEEMDYGRPLTEEQIEEERRKIMDVIKQLESTGKIAIREKKRSNILEGEEAEVHSGFSSGIMESPTEISSQQTQEGTDAHNEVGIRAYEAGDYAHAAQMFQSALQAQPEEPSLYQYLGHSYYALGQNAEALECYERAIELDSENEEFKKWVEEFRANLSVPTS